ncbi:hypothetical protein BCR39DRAFT_551197 [Naematelia encephala]|uniref:Uncharacterized protein n=1 Tax=Naematelia encephala TaxID=71784 RepID=A0A1Y2AJD1_9TREE|nr:hypothetical protein BCR39DRAFT_551197 [Naematelia encephala]
MLISFTNPKHATLFPFLLFGSPCAHYYSVLCFVPFVATFAVFPKKGSRQLGCKGLKTLCHCHFS